MPHIIIKSPDSVDAGYFRYQVECPGRPECDGWQECREPHLSDGWDANDEYGNPNDCPEDAPWFDEEVFDFHGVAHTWQGGFGWTVPFEGCVVRANLNACVDIAEDLLWDLPAGRYPVEDHWDEGELEALTLAKPAAIPCRDEATV